MHIILKDTLFIHTIIYIYIYIMKRCQMISITKNVTPIHLVMPMI